MVLGVCQVDVPPGQEIVGHHHGVIVLQQPINKVTPDEPGSTADQDSHASTPSHAL